MHEWRFDVKDKEAGLYDKVLVRFNYEIEDKIE